MAKKNLDSEEQEAVRSEQVQNLTPPPRLRGDLLVLRRQLRSALNYLEHFLEASGVKL